ncbi:MAG TPA: ribulose-phosphate 3-epimerase [Thermoplasmata archaeon]|nr:ribulose-phosphate 3-epimerase [Thermoplasmata archaeon]
MPVGARRLVLAPSLLSADFGALGDAVRAAEAGGADAFHLDVMDGHFVPNLSFGPALVAAVRARTRKPLDVHLMIEDPLRYVEAFRRAGGDTLVFHAESRSEPRSVIAAVHALGARVGVALKPETPLDAALPWLGEIDELMVMGVHPGFSGQPFLPEVLPKLSEARRRIDALGRSVELAIDGGITVETARATAAHGASFFVCGQSVYGAGAVEANLARLRAAVEEGARREVP